jgi:hypothetical protein
MRAAVQSHVQSQRDGELESSLPSSGCAMRFQKSQPAGAAIFNTIFKFKLAIIVKC